MIGVVSAGRIVHRGRWTREHRAEDRWPRLPFEVGRGVRAVTVTLDHDRSGGAVIDLGCEGAAGWRGWSGGARTRNVIAPGLATPGYLPGELEPGTWHVVLGLHRLPPGGVDYTVTISTADPPALDPVRPSPPPPARRPPRDLPVAPGLRWVATDLHAHTVHSDGSRTVDELAALAVAAGLEALAVTDHNTVSHHAELAAAGRRYCIALLPGQEITTELGHANAFGDIGWVDFRRPAAEWLSTVDGRGGLLSVNHPLAADCAWRHPMPVRPPLAEVWHSSWHTRLWGGPVAWWQAWGSDVTPVGGSDWHAGGWNERLAAPTTWVAVDAAAGGPDELVLAVLEGLRAGRTAVSADLAAPVLLPTDGEPVAVDAPDALVLGDQVLADHDGTVLALAASSGASAWHLS